MARGSKLELRKNLSKLNDIEINNTLSKLRPNKDIEQAKRLLSRVKVLIDYNCWVIRDDWSYYTVFEQIAAHRLSYELFIGNLIFDSLHKCDRKGCINPDHLFQGKDRTNRRDWVIKKRRTLNLHKLQATRWRSETGIATNPNKIIKPWHDFHS